MNLVKKLTDSYENVKAALGLRTNNLTKSGTYDFDPLVNQRQTLENMQMGSVVANKIIEIPATDMTSAGVTFVGLEKQEIVKLDKAIRKLCLWNRLCTAIKWARLYGGSVIYIAVDGQDPASPLDLETIGPDQLTRFEVYSRWQVQPNLTTYIEGGLDHGKPEYYMNVIDNKLTTIPFTIHHSRLIRFIGLEVPWFSEMRLMLWGQSVLVNMHAQIKAYDAVFTMITQLANKVFLRVLKVEGLRQEISMAGEDGEQAMLAYANLIRDYQSTEDVTLIDSTDTLEFTQYDLNGLKDLMEICGEQLSLASGIPQSKLFGRQSDGLGATHTGDITNYYAELDSKRESQLREPLNKIFEILSYSVLGKELPDDFDFTFDSLEKVDDQERADLSTKMTDNVVKTYSAKLVTLEEARKQLRLNGDITHQFQELEESVKLDELQSNQEPINTDKEQEEKDA